MSESKFDKYIVKDIKAQPQDIHPDVMHRMAWLDETVCHGAPYFESVFVLKDIPNGPGEHCHEFDEFLGCMSADPTTEDLGCTVQVYIEGELHEFTKNFVIYVPPGTKHCPLNFLNVTRPVINYSGGPNVEYLRKYEDGTYRVN